LNRYFEEFCLENKQIHVDAFVMFPMNIHIYKKKFKHKSWSRWIKRDCYCV